MRKYISWNNHRRNSKYWSSLAMLMFVSANISWYLKLDNTVIRRIIYILDDVFEPVVVFGDPIVMSLICVCATFILLFIGIVMLLNHLVGMIPDIRSLKICRLWQLLSKSAVWADILLGILLETMAILSIRDIYIDYNSFSLISLFYTVFLGVGSYRYWNNILPMAKYHKVKGTLLKGKGYLNAVWFGLSNADIRLSTFDRVPRKGTISEVIVDQQDLAILNELSDKSPSRTQFLYYLICVDCNKVLDSNFKQQMMSVINIPHARTLVCFFGNIHNDAVLKELREDISNCVNVKVKCFNSPLTRELDLEQCISSLDFRQYETDKVPTRFLLNEQLIHTYLGAADGPKLCLDFLKMIINKLETLPAIYALFDYIDLLYRISIAYAREPDYKWMKKQGCIVGNIRVMATIIMDKVLAPNLSDKKIKIGEKSIVSTVFTDREQALVRKYLPNYQEDSTRRVYYTIVYLTSSLRNVLRGHGYFDTKDADDLYRLVFKLTLMNMHILASSDIHLKVSDQVVWLDGCFKYYAVIGGDQSKKAKQLSPFLVASENGDILVFNNWCKMNSQHDSEQIEYINYLDGTLVLPEFRVINLSSTSSAII